MIMSYLNDTFSLEGKTVLITGGGGAIAGAMTAALLRAGANVSLCDLKMEFAEDGVKRAEVESQITGKLLAVEADTTDETATLDAVKKTEERFGSVDVLINAAGGNRGKSPFTEVDVEQFEFVLKLNLIAGLVVPTKVLAKYWIDKGIKGSIINLASMTSYIPLSGVWAYDAAKAGVMNLTMAASKEFAPKGIRVNAIAPGFFIGKQNRALLIDEETGDLTPRGKDVISRTPFGRFGDVEELGGVTVFLSSNIASGFITGVTIPVDGGFLVDNI
jgi:NAD(P)-dependent dehydrogenase (short-subunit alcohol dehydrogenase family)